MKKHFKSFTLLASFLIICAGASAQISAGLRVGVNLANGHLKSEDVQAERSLLPLAVVSVPVEITISERFSFQPELGYIGKGLHISEEETGDKISFKLQENYLELGVLAKWKLWLSDQAELGLLAGPSLGYMLSGKTITTETLNGVETREEDKIDFENDEVRRGDLGVNLGLFAARRIGAGKAFVEVRYQLGFTNAAKEAENGDGFFNRGIQVGVGYMIPLN